MPPNRANAFLKYTASAKTFFSGGPLAHKYAVSVGEGPKKKVIRGAEVLLLES